MQVSNAIWVRDQFISVTGAAQALAAIHDFRREFPLPIISRTSGPRPLCYSVINGHQILSYLPEIQRLHAKVTRLIKRMFGESIVPLADEQVACNINITQPGGSYRYHYDRNTITAILYLNETDGGETECYPNHRLRISQTFLQETIDRIFQSEVVRWTFGRLVLVRPRTGRLLIMRGNRCLHSVREVNGSEDRVNVVMSYDVRGAQYANSDRLNSYLYTHNDLQTRDPNYA